MERFIKYALERSYNTFAGNYKDIVTLEDMLKSFYLKEICMILEETEDEYSLGQLIQFANEVVQELKAKKEAQAV